jgi:acetyl esterase/lipase
MFLETLRADLNSPKHVLLLAGDDVWSKLPPTYLMAGAKDPLRDDSIVIEKRLAQLGVPVRLDLISGFPHYAHVSLVLLNQ